jgi:hypothetical protein
MVYSIRREMFEEKRGRGGRSNNVIILIAPGGAASRGEQANLPSVDL